MGSLVRRRRTRLPAFGCRLRKPHMPVSGLDAVDWVDWSETGWIELDWDGLG
jgi:hypothetical protein